MKKFTLLFLIISFLSATNAQTVTFHDDFGGCITKIAIDEDNDVLWMGTSLSDGGDLFMRDKNGNRTDLADLNNTINFQSITALWMEESTLYVGGYGGIAMIDHESDEYTFYTTSNSNYSNSNVPSTLVFDYNSDKLYAGNFTTSTDVLDDNGWSKDNSLKRILASAFDYEEDVLWMASSSGELIRIVDDEKTIFNSSNSSLPNLSYVDLAVDANGNVYLLAHQNGFVHFDGENATHYTPQNSDLFGGDLNSIDVDLFGTVWFGHNGGITSFNDGLFHTYVLEDAVGFWPTINDIVVDNENHLWLGACGGLIEFSLESTHTLDEVDRSSLLYPNPSSGHFTFESNGTGVLEIINIQGKILSKQRIQDGINNIYLNLPGGIYMYKFNGQSNHQSGKLIIQ